MTRILVQRGSSSNSNRNTQQTASQASSVLRDEQQDKEGIPEIIYLDDHLCQCESVVRDLDIRIETDKSPGGHQDIRIETVSDVEKEKCGSDDFLDTETIVKDLEGLTEDAECSFSGSSQIVTERSHPPPPPVPPPKPFITMSGQRRALPGNSNSASRRALSWPVVSIRTSPSNSRPSSPRSVNEAEGYNSADEQNNCFKSSYGDAERECFFEMEIRRVKGLEVRRMVEDGNCLFRAVADQVYGDPEAYDLARQMCIDYMERERDHFSQFITEGFLSYCKRKRRDKVYGNNVEIQAFSEMYNRPIHIYSYSTDPINIFHGAYNTDTPPLRLSYHHGNHYNSLVDPRRMSVGAGLGLSTLQGANIDKDQVKAAIKAQQDQQIDNALLAEGRFYSDLEFTEKEIEQMVIEASRIEYLAEEKSKQQLERTESSTSASEPSSSRKGLSPTKSNLDGRNNMILPDASKRESMQVMLDMGFSYLQASEACSIFGEDVDSMICYLLDIGGNNGSSCNSRQKGKAAE